MVRFGGAIFLVRFCLKKSPVVWFKKVSKKRQSDNGAEMKCSRADSLSAVYRIPDIKFEDQRMTSFAGIVMYQALFQALGLKEGLRSCFSHLKVSPIFGHHMITLLLVVHILIGFRRLRDRDYYHDDPMIQRVLGVKRIPDVSTITRVIKSADEESIEKVRILNKSLVMDRLEKELASRVTIDFDGSVLTTQTRAEGTAVGFNRKKKGARSYYPLFATIAQTSQVFDMHHRSGNVHDSNGSTEFMFDVFMAIRERLPGAVLESRVDGAFFEEDRFRMMEEVGVEFSASVPFERFPELKGMIEARRRWKRIDDTWSYFEADWKPKSWPQRFRFIFIRQTAKRQHKGPLQLDLFVPVDHEYQYKVIVTNKTCSAKKVLNFHNGRGSQEAVLAQLKSGAQIDYIPTKSLIANKLYSWAAILAHNLHFEMQMRYKTPDRSTTERRTPLWTFTTLNTIRQRLIQRAGRLTRPQGNLVLTMSGNEAVREDLIAFLNAAQDAS